MTKRLVVIALTGLALAAPVAASEPSPRTDEYLHIRFTDILISSLHEGRVVATGRPDARGNFRLTLPPGASGPDQVCLNGASVRSAMQRADPGPASGPGAGDQQRAETLVEILVVIALTDGVRPVNDPPQVREHRLVIPGARIRAGQQSRSAEPDLCFRPFGDGPAGPTTERFTVPPIAANGQRQHQRTDPRIPPPAVRTGPGGSPAPRPSVVTGTIRVVN